jgi:hypothetical protein
LRVGWSVSLCVSLSLAGPATTRPVCALLCSALRPQHSSSAGLQATATDPQADTTTRAVVGDKGTGRSRDPLSQPSDRLIRFRVPGVSATLPGSQTTPTAPLASLSLWQYGAERSAGSLQRINSLHVSRRHKRMRSCLCLSVCTRWQPTRKPWDQRGSDG